MVRVRAAVPLSILIVTTILSPVAAENWPQWRGPGGQGVSTEQQLPTDWQRRQEHRLEGCAAGRVTRRRWSGAIASS